MDWLTFPFSQTSWFQLVRGLSVKCTIPSGTERRKAKRGDTLHFEKKIANQTLLIVSLESPFAGISVATTQKKGEEKLTAVVS